MEFSRPHDLHRHRTAEEAPCFQVWHGKWSIAAQGQLNKLYGHDAKSMRNFTLHFDNENQCESLDRLWFGEVWFPVEKYVCQDQYSISPDRVLDPAELDLEPGQDEPELCFARSQIRDPA